ncbi:3-deoxy-D-manno-octulosonic acid kinase [Pelistega suis]|uniref:3-deoxy-D-manno-octulosonic acid kinase n=1 Tax=Pelistega suis TaxID=1631957 RepID=UPI00211CDACC|nr:3-deoxy-D-manno-octulosonic acid kinase [Pelistega suis]MCQ9329797.1 3-deoxy-D-manno-octulosonic acid kinase [Pelistega suis]
MISPKDSRIVCSTSLQDILNSDFFGLEQEESLRRVYASVRAVAVGGRNAAWFVEHSLFSGVLRHYRRGGLIAKLIKQSYWWLGAEKTRAWEEFKVMQYLANHHFPVPTPLAAMYVRQGFFYKAALLTATIPNAKTLVEYLQSQKEQDYPDLAIKVAQSIHQMHRLNVNHADLNAFNILLDEQARVYIIDFDKARIEVAQGQWCWDNINRLERHLQKVLGEQGQTFMVYIRQNLNKS